MFNLVAIASHTDPTFFLPLASRDSHARTDFINKVVNLTKLLPVRPSIPPLLWLAPPVPFEADTQ